MPDECFAFISGLLVASVAIGAGYSTYSADIGFSVNPETAALARFGHATTENTCSEVAKFSKRLNGYFAERAEGKHVSETAVFAITKDDCTAMMRAKTAARRSNGRFP